MFFGSCTQNVKLMLIASPGIGFVACEIQGVEVSRINLVLRPSDEAR
jgi:hypothetical protein